MKDLDGCYIINITNSKKDILLLVDDGLLFLE